MGFMILVSGVYGIRLCSERVAALRVVVERVGMSAPPAAAQ